LTVTKPIIKDFERMERRGDFGVRIVVPKGNCLEPVLD
jgi:hypothetical protein